MGEALVHRSVLNSSAYFCAHSSSRAVVIGASTGGPALLQSVLAQFTGDSPTTFFVVQHMPAEFVGMLGKCLQKNCRMPVMEACPGLKVEPGRCYIAAANRHLTLRRNTTGELVICTPAYPQTRFMPSVDITMKSVANEFGARTVGVVMSGMGDDGAEGMCDILNAGGRTLVESDETAVMPEMPRAVLTRGGAQQVVPAYRLASTIQEVLSEG